MNYKVLSIALAVLFVSVIAVQVAQAGVTKTGANKNDICITVTDDELRLGKEAFAKAYKYESQVLDENGTLIDNPIGEQKFMVRQMARYFNEVVQSNENRKEYERLRALAEQNTTRISAQE
jgi:hypothetical protein